MSADRKAFLSFQVSQPGGASAPAGSTAPPRLYCFPYAGGTASMFAPWARALAPQFAVLGVELPGHGSRFQETPLDRVSEMAEAVAEAITASQSTTPYAFYGHSLGAIVAFETARILQRERSAGQPPVFHLFAAAARAPHLPPVLPPISELPQTEFLDAVQNRYGGLPAALFNEPELLELVLPVLRADFRAYEGYRYTGTMPLDCPITAFHGIHDTVVRSAAVGEWFRATESRFRLEEMAGDHFFLNDCRDLLLQRIRTSFQQPVPTSADHTPAVFSVNCAPS